jgi:hypothetical protein
MDWPFASIPSENDDVRVSLQESFVKKKISIFSVLFDIAYPFCYNSGWRPKGEVFLNNLKRVD